MLTDAYTALRRRDEYRLEWQAIDEQDDAWRVFTEDPADNNDSHLGKLHEWVYFSRGKLKLIFREPFGILMDKQTYTWT